MEVKEPSPKVASFEKVAAEDIQLTVQAQQNQLHQFQKVSQKECEILKSTYKKLPRFKKLEILFEVVALITFVLTWVYFKSEYEELPREVPIEFDVNGKVVRKESKEFLYAFPGIETMAYILLSVLQFVQEVKPRRYRQPLTVWNAQNVYRATRILLLYTKLVTEIMFLYLIFMMIKVLSSSEPPRVMYYVFSFAILYIVGAVRYLFVIKKITRG